MADPLRHAPASPESRPTGRRRHSAPRSRRTAPTPVGVLLLVGLFAGPAGAQAPGALPAEVPLPAGHDSLIRVDDHPAEGRMEIVLGPVALPADLPHLRVPIQTASWPRDGWLKGYEWTLVDGRGDTLPDAMLHHLGVMDPTRRQLFSPIAQRLVAAGAETEGLELPMGVGVPMSGGDPLLVVGMFANPTDRAVEAAYLHLDVRYVSEQEAFLPRISVRPFYLDVMGPLGDKSFPVPPGRTVKSWEGSPAVDARVLGIGGHAHDYARRLSLVDVTTGDTVWSVEPELREDGSIADVPEETFLLETGRELEAGHIYRTTVVYENPTDEPAPHGGMGVIAGAVRTGGDAWPPFDAGDPLLRADLWNTLTSPVRAGLRPGGHGHGPLHGSPPGAVQDTTEWRARLAEDGDAWPDDVFGGPAPWEAGGESR